MQIKTAVALSCVLTVAMPRPGLAADPATDAMQAAYAPYRVALFRTNSGAQRESALALATASQAWQAVVDRFAAQPPAPYDRDAQFAATLARVGAVYARASVQIDEQHLGEAHETLEQARELVAQLRRRNGVQVYSDHMNAYHAEMEQLLAAGPQELAAPKGWMWLMARVGTLDYLARRLRSEAPADLLAQPDFPPLLQALEASVADLRAAALEGNLAATRQAMGQLKAPYSKLFLKFG